MDTGYIVLIVLLLADPGLCLYKRWQRSTNFGNADNWMNGRAPCGNDVVNIPNNSPVVYIQTNTSLKELGLPDNGEIILGQNSVLSFTDQPDPNCPGVQGDLEYNIPSPRKWVDPDNWCSSTTEKGDCGTVNLLETERVPCASDDAIFPRGKTFYVDTGTNLNINVRAVKLSAKTFITSNDFTRYVQTSEGMRIFPPPKTGSRSSISISGQRCDNPTGCSCGNDQGKIYEQICTVYKNKCDRAMCKAPFRPIGACCDLCGAQFNGTVGTGFRIEDFTKIFSGFIADNGFTGQIELIISKTSNGTIQAVLKDANGENSTKLAKIIRNDIDADSKTGGHKYRLDGIQLMVSTGAEVIQPIHRPSSQTGGKLGGGGISGIIIALIVLAALIVFGLLFYRNKTGKSDNMLDDLRETPRRIQRQLSRGRRVPDDVIRRPAYGFEMEDGFGNPLYGDIGGASNPNIRPMELREIQPTFDTRDSDGGFNNPLYDTVKNVQQSW